MQSIIPDRKFSCRNLKLSMNAKARSGQIKYKMKANEQSVQRIKENKRPGKNYEKRSGARFSVRLTVR